MVESQHVAVNLGRWLVDLQLWLKQQEPVDASSPASLPFFLSTVPNGLEIPPEQGGTLQHVEAYCARVWQSGDTHLPGASGPVPLPGSPVIRRGELNSFKGLSFR